MPHGRGLRTSVAAATRLGADVGGAVEAPVLSGLVSKGLVVALPPGEATFRATHVRATVYVYNLDILHLVLLVPGTMDAFQ